MPDSLATAYDALTVGGVPVLPLPQYNVWGNHYFVDGNAGNDDGPGTRDRPWLTMAEAFTHIRSGDTIHLRGNIREQISTPAGIFGVTIVGPSEVTRHGDSYTGAYTNGGFEDSATWRAPTSPTASTPLLTIQQQGWKIKNILFTGDEDDSVSCIRLFRNSAAEGTLERDAGHTVIQGCRFQAGLYGIEDHGGNARCWILDNEFMLFSVSDNRAMVSTTGAGSGTLWGWKILRNTFRANHTDIDMALDNAQIMFNHFVKTALGVSNTVTIDTSGGVSGFNVISKNWMYRASNATGVNAGFVLGTSDSYAGNYWNDVEEYAEPAE
jgi:hypothetical protein